MRIEPRRCVPWSPAEKRKPLPKISIFPLYKTGTISKNKKVYKEKMRLRKSDGRYYSNWPCLPRQSRQPSPRRPEKRQKWSCKTYQSINRTIHQSIKQFYVEWITKKSINQSIEWRQHHDIFVSPWCLLIALNCHTQERAIYIYSCFYPANYAYVSQNFTHVMAIALIRQRPTYIMPHYYSGVWNVTPSTAENRERDETGT